MHDDPLAFYTGLLYALGVSAVLWYAAFQLTLYAISS